MNGRSGVEDFNMHFAIQDVCNNFNAQALEGAGYSSWRPDLAYGFVDNPDTDTSPGQQVAMSKLLGYAFLLSIACRQVLIYGKDYYGGDVWPGAYGLKPWIDNLIYINRTFAYGNTTTRWLDDKVMVLERDGKWRFGGTKPGFVDLPQLRHVEHPGNNLCNLVWLERTFAGLHRASLRYLDRRLRKCHIYHSGERICRRTELLVLLGCRADKPIHIQSRRTTQVFFGAPDLDIPGAIATRQTAVGRIYVAADSKVSFTTKDKIEPVLLDDSKTVADNQVGAKGWYSIAVSTESTVEIPFELTVTYEAPSTI